MTMISHATVAYLQHNDSSITEIFITDKDCAEMSSLQTVFPQAKNLLCQFHVLCAVDKRLHAAKMHVNEQQEAYEWFTKALRAKNQETIEAARRHLCTIGNTLHLPDQFKS